MYLTLAQKNCTLQLLASIGYIYIGNKTYYVDVCALCDDFSQLFVESASYREVWPLAKVEGEWWARAS